MSFVFTAMAFEKYIFDLMSMNKNYRNISSVQDSNIWVDFLAQRRKNEEWEQIAIEVKSSVSFTLGRARILVNKFLDSRLPIKEKKFVLVINGILSKNVYDFLTQNGIEIWDINFIKNEFSEEIKLIPNPMGEYQQDKALITREEELIKKLKMCKSGKKEWNVYQKLIGEIIEILFCPPLDSPISERADFFKVNRRDFIFPNYAEQGFWNFLRSRYLADYIVIDAKNYTSTVTKKEVIQIANYLKPYGTGLFGIIISRKGARKNAVITLREVWSIDKKLIIVLDDNDIEQMLLNKLNQKEPSEVLKQKIEDFRLSL